MIFYEDTNLKKKKKKKKKKVDGRELKTRDSSIRCNNNFSFD
jgi:hypothetical protein